MSAPFARFRYPFTATLKWGEDLREGCALLRIRNWKRRVAMNMNPMSGVPLAPRLLGLAGVIPQILCVAILLAGPPLLAWLCA